MARAAKVTSIDAVTHFSAALRGFQDESTKALENVELEVRRAVDWIQVEQKEYWTAQLRRAERHTEEAKLNLQRCKMFKKVGNHRPACIEEKRDVERAKRRLRLCREQIEAVGHWSRVVDQAVFEYEGGVGQLARWLETEADKSVAILDRLSRTLHDYVGTGTSGKAANAVESLPPEYVPDEEDKETEAGKSKDETTDDLNASSQIEPQRGNPEEST